MGVGSACMAQALGPVAALNRGVDRTWQFIRDDKWGVELFFLFFQTVIIGGMASLFVVLQRWSRNVRTSVAAINSKAGRAKELVDKFISDFDAIENPETQPGTWRNHGSLDLGSTYYSAGAALSELEIEIESELVFWDRIGRNYPVFAQYDGFVEKVASNFDTLKSTNQFSTLAPKLSAIRPGLEDFLEYKFSLGRVPPVWGQKWSTPGGSYMANEAEIHLSAENEGQ